MNIKDFAEKFIKAEEEVFQKGNFDALKAIEDPKVIWHLMARSYDIVGFEAHKQYLSGLGMISSNGKHEWKYLTGEGNIFALSFKATITLKSGMGSAGEGTPFALSFKATDTLKSGMGSVKEMTFNTIQVFRLNKGKITEVWTNGTTTVSN